MNYFELRNIFKSRLTKCRVARSFTKLIHICATVIHTWTTSACTVNAPYRLLLPCALKLSRFCDAQSLVWAPPNFTAQSRRALFCPGDLQHLRLAPPSQPPSQPASRQTEWVGRRVYPQTSRCTRSDGGVLCGGQGPWKLFGIRRCRDLRVSPGRRLVDGWRVYRDKPGVGDRNTVVIVVTATSCSEDDTNARKLHFRRNYWSQGWEMGRVILKWNYY